MINFIALITSLRLKMLDRRINKLEREVRHFRLEVEELKAIFSITTTLRYLLSLES